MIAFLRGKVLAKTKDSLIIETNGVGYEVFSPVDVFVQATKGKEMAVFVYTIVREQEISLYGLASLEDRQFFELLLSVSGIGPKSALEFLSLPQSFVKDAIATGDTEALTKVKGIGKKTAERVVVELKNKIGTVYKIENILEKESTHETSEDIISALENLGYDRISIVKKLKNAPTFPSVEEAIMWFLQNN